MPSLVPYTKSILRCLFAGLVGGALLAAGTTPAPLSYSPAFDQPGNRVTARPVSVSRLKVKCTAPASTAVAEPLADVRRHTCFLDSTAAVRQATNPSQRPTAHLAAATILMQR